MANMNITQLVSEMQRLATEARSIGESSGAPSSGFADLLRNAVDTVNETQGNAQAKAEAFERGDREMSLPEVMIALQKANLSFTAMTEVRNRVVSAYQEIMSMPI